MPIREVRLKNGGGFFQYGKNRGKKYYYRTRFQRNQAYSKAVRQMRAIFSTDIEVNKLVDLYHIDKDYVMDAEGILTIYSID